MSVWRYQPLDLRSVQLTDRFWTEWQRHMVQVGLPHQWKMCEETGRIENIERAARGETGGFKGHRFNDSDIYKLLEATAYGAASGIDGGVMRKSRSAIDTIRSAQGPDGYINSHVQLTYPECRWKSLNSMHEMYCIGHLIEAAVGYKEAANDDTLVDAGTRAAECVMDTFGPEQRLGYCGHPEIELAFARLYGLTADRRLKESARWMIEMRGSRPSPFEGEFNDPGIAELSPGARPLFHFEDGTYDGAYAQDDLPLRRQTRAVGHSVRAMYLYCGAVDVLSDDPGIASALRSIWRHLTDSQIYVTGGIGASGRNEGFSDDYDLPNKVAYAETCAAIGLVMWAWRMFLWTGDSKYLDTMERTLYNAVLSGVSLSCDRYFYDNPFESNGQHKRKPWFDCACCPPNIARLLLSIGRYFLAVGDSEIYVGLPISGSYRTRWGSVDVEANYPWSGEFNVIVKEARGLDRLSFRVPEWATSCDVWVNGLQSQIEPIDGTISIDRQWAAGDTLRVVLAMPAQWLTAHERVLDCAGRVALRRGPLVYCLEGSPHHWSVDTEYGVATQTDTGSSRVAVTLNAEGSVETPPSQALYCKSREQDFGPKRMEFIPYFSWANDGQKSMQVWVRRGR